MKNCMISSTMGKDSKQFFLFGARWAFGSWLLYVGVSKWIGGAPGFIAYINKTFAETWLPEPLLLATAWIILIAEPLIGLLLLVGKQQRMVWTIAAKLMFMLMLGKTLVHDYASVANNWQYFVLALACAALSDPCSCKEE